MPARPVFLRDLPALLVEGRTAKRLTQRGAAEVGRRRGLAGVSYQAIQRLEKGKTKNPEPELLKALAELYDISYERLVQQWARERYGVDVAEPVISVQRPLTSPDHPVDKTPRSAMVGEEDLGVAPLASAFVACAYVLDERLNHDPQLALEFMRDLPDLLAQWKRKHNVRE